MSVFCDTLKQSLDEAGIVCGQEQAEQCEAYFRLVFEANKRMNLTRITDEAQAARQHFADSARVLALLDMPAGANVIDIGTGAGFPGMPVKILRPDTELTLLDSSGKKCDFIKSASERLGISVTVLTARAEEAAKGPLRESYDIALSRAVAQLNMLVELCAPFVKAGGVFAAWKGESYGQELSEAQRAIDALGCRVRSTDFIDPGAIILLEKQKPAPDIYPRRFAKIKASPL